MGDMNSRVGDMKDYIPEVDEIASRVIVDNADNSHGKAFIDFLIETKMAIVNGRCCTAADDFTCISHKGSSVVDYFVVAHENLQHVTDFAVLPVTDVVDNLRLMDEVEGRISEHSILKMSLCVSQNETLEMLRECVTNERACTNMSEMTSPMSNAHVAWSTESDLTLGESNRITSSMQTSRDKPPTRYRIKQWCPDFLHNTDNAKKCLEWIERQEAIIENQEKMDTIYNELQCIIINELNKFYKPVAGLKNHERHSNINRKNGGMRVWKKGGMC